MKLPTRISLAIIALTMLILPAPDAAADTVDNDMQQRLYDVGVSLDAHTTGLKVCAALHAQPNAAGVEIILTQYQQNLSQFQAGAIVGASVKLYCPEMVGALNLWLISKGAKPLPLAVTTT